MPRGLILGDAACVHDDATAALEMFTPDAIAATNNMGIEWPERLDYWFTLHPERCPDWPGIVEALRLRREAGRNRPQIWAHKIAPGIDRHTADWTGSTGLLAVKGLLEEGFERIVLCGVPMSREGAHFYNERAWLQAERYRAGWVQHKQEIAPFVRSLSGWTRDQFGEPNPEWLAV